MKTHVIAGPLVFVISCTASLVSAQNFDDPSPVPTFPDRPEKATAIQPEEAPVYLSQYPPSLHPRGLASRDLESVVDLKLLRNPSPYWKFAVSLGRDAGEPLSADLKAGLDLISATYRELGVKSSCPEISLSIGQRIKLDPGRTLETVSIETAANPGCACEIVKAAIRTVEADSELTAAIVEAAITAAPETVRIVSQCAIAEMPEALNAVQAVLARLDPGAGEIGYSSKDAKSAKAAPLVGNARTADPPQASPLDLPPLYPIPPPPIMPPMVTYVDP